MVAGGLAEPMPDHAGAAAELALEMLELAARQRLPDGGPLRLRIGIASGPVVAGVIGRRRFSYDLWGDTGQHRQSDGGNRGPRMHPGHRADPWPARRSLPVSGAREDPGQGQGEDAHLLPERASSRARPHAGPDRAPIVRRTSLPISPSAASGPIPLQPRPGRRTTVILVSDAVGSA